MTDRLAESDDQSQSRIDLLFDILWLAPVFIFVWMIMFIWQPVKTLKTTWQLIRGEYHSESTYSDDLDFVDRMWIEDRRED